MLLGCEEKGKVRTESLEEFSEDYRNVLVTEAFIEKSVWVISFCHYRNAL